ncbi:MAG: hypothetical protein AAB872_00665 [Patescibacteria group bacterium]
MGKWRNGYKRPNPARDRETRNIRDRRKRKELRSWYIQYKSHLKCSVCDENHPAALDFHHKDPSTKLLEIGTMVSSVPKFSKEKITEEINKCLVICSNCHKKLHWKESHS